VGTTDSTFYGFQPKRRIHGSTDIYTTDFQRGSLQKAARRMSQHFESCLFHNGLFQGARTMNGRRHFVLQLAPLAGAATLLPQLARAQNLPALSETDPMAIALGFRPDTTKVNQSKYPSHANDQTCGNCLHFLPPGGASARCDLFSKTVPKDGWCSAYARRP
jgi:hypothetical protein